jgi:hypothetical protein
MIFTANDKLTGRQHFGALNLGKPPALMRGKAFQKPPRCWRSGEVTGYAMLFIIFFYWRPGIPSPLHIFLASFFEISMCRGTVSTDPFAGFIQSE